MQDVIPRLVNLSDLHSIRRLKQIHLAYAPIYLGKPLHKPSGGKRGGGVLVCESKCDEQSKYALSQEIPVPLRT